MTLGQSNELVNLGTVVTTGGAFTYVDATGVSEAAGSINTTAAGAAGGAVSITAGGALALGNINTSGT
ncbi:hypothetical protein, partial [Undibacterium luofuense]|uniref:hypothetical protein n=1 Tax=Undibacterium luofuense TaxID=2828733 RepID=UPI0030EBA0E3